jgi:CRISPR-associated protein Cmr5
MSQTLDQQRAAFAWECASAGMDRARGEKERKEYKVLAKGAPALIMNSGLMPTLAFYAHKGSSAGLLLEHLLAGLSLRLKPNPQPRSFSEFMRHLQGSESQLYLRYTDEALEILKWIRQFVDAVDA